MGRTLPPKLEGHRHHVSGTGVWAIRRGRFYDALISGPRWQLVRLRGNHDPRAKILAYCGPDEAVGLLREWGFVTLLDSVD
jgi:hypothetical protein